MPNAALRGDLEALQWAREHGCPWDGRTWEFAAEGGHPAVFRWAWENDCEWDEEDGCRLAARGGNLEVLKQALALGCPWNGSSSCSHGRAWSNALCTRR